MFRVKQQEKMNELKGLNYAERLEYARSLQEESRKRQQTISDKPEAFFKKTKLLTIKEEPHIEKWLEQKDAMQIDNVQK